MEFIKQQTTEIIEINSKFPEKKLNAEWMSYDKNVHKVVVPVRTQSGIAFQIDEIEEVLVYLKYSKGSFGPFDGKVEDEEQMTVSFEIPDEVRGQTGTVNISMMLNLSDGRQVDLVKFTATARLSAVDAEAPAMQEYYLPMYEDLVADIEVQKEKFDAASIYNKAEVDSKVNPLVSGKADKTYVDSMLSSIAQGGPRELFYSLAALKAKYPNGADGTYLVFDSATTDGAHSYIWDSSTRAWKDLGVYQAVMLDNFVANNLIKNGNFMSGLTGGWVASAATHAVSNGTLTNTADGSQIYGIEQQAISGLAIGNKYYVRLFMTPKTAKTQSLRMRMVYANEPYIVVSNPVKDRDYNISGIFSATENLSNVQFSHYYNNSTDANGSSVTITNVVAIDLTAVFGHGNEPSVSEMDKVMSYFPQFFFDGTTGTLIDNPALYDLIYQLRNNSLATRSIQGTGQQITVENPDGKNGNPKISIPKNPMLMQPNVTATSYGPEMAPTIGSWIGKNGSSFSNGAWTIPELGMLESTFSVEKDSEYEISLTWTSTDDYTALNIPKLVVSLGAVVSEKQFTGYSDALYKLTLTANETGNVVLRLGNGIEKWTATITEISIKKVTGKVTPAGKLGIGSFDITTSGDNFAIGNGLQKRTSGLANVGYGLGALRDVTVGRYNNAFGTYALEKLDTGLNNVAVGHAALRNLKSGYYNIGIGYSAMLSNVTGSWNIAIGNECMRNLTDGIRNTVVGSRAFNDITTGSRNVGMGREAGFYPAAVNRPTTTGSDNVFVGFRSGQSTLDQADRSVAIGSYATATTDSVAIGANSRAASKNSVAIGAGSVASEGQIVLGTNSNSVYVPGKLILARYTPTDDDGEIGSIVIDDNNVYVKTANGWKKAILQALD
ncbi:hypothetical protein A5886_002144 [Enterococcus sp. 8G7_MSG3316]|uniref:Trimeric autotransporter adhesin YadA-like head domain-containing protein n=1 Tax=Candidatus Enterococcus testudinis TaxID=1834191 RepID=A0A242A7R3_9ENTE|nr:BppU family phage baseplate upper protein [Enterococcus sp. 8G7_MSG3316]OTN77064.1 hypothetical protein A5886_002144 [Enterococcus sp. 8G7_MSG3316]